MSHSPESLDSPDSPAHVSYPVVLDQFDVHLLKIGLRIALRSLPHGEYQVDKDGISEYQRKSLVAVKLENALSTVPRADLPAYFEIDATKKAVAAQNPEDDEVRPSLEVGMTLEDMDCINRYYTDKVVFFAERRYDLCVEYSRQMRRINEAFEASGAPPRPEFTTLRQVLPNIPK